MSNKENDKGHEISPGMLKISVDSKMDFGDTSHQEMRNPYRGLSDMPVFEDDHLNMEHAMGPSFYTGRDRRKWGWRFIMLNVLRVVGLILIALYFTACGHLRFQDDPLYYTNKVDSQDEYSNPWVALEKTKHVKTRYLEGEKEPILAPVLIVIDARDVRDKK